MSFRGFEKHRLTSRERRVVITVAIIMAIVLALWIAAMVVMLPNPSQGLV